MGKPTLKHGAHCRGFPSHISSSNNHAATNFARQSHHGLNKRRSLRNHGSIDSRSCRILCGILEKSLRRQYSRSRLDITIPQQPCALAFSRSAAFDKISLSINHHFGLDRVRSSSCLQQAVCHERYPFNFRHTRESCSRETYCNSLVAQRSLKLRLH